MAEVGSRCRRAAPGWIALALLLPTGWSLPARAQSSASEAKSRARFDEASKLESGGDWSRACPLYQEAHDLNATGGTALRAANCYEQIGEDEKALALYRFIVDKRASDPKPERVTIAEARIVVLERKLRHKPATASPAGSPPAAPTASAAPPMAPAAAPRGAPATSEAPSRTPAWIAFGLGGAGLAVGSIFGVLALSKAGDVKTACQTSCGAAEREEADGATALGWVSNVGFGVAIAGVATGVILLAVGSGSSSPSARRVPLPLAVGPRGVAVRF